MSPSDLRTALVVSVSLLSLGACGTVPGDASPEASPGPAGGPSGAGGWARLPDSPLSPREGPAAAHVPTEDGDLAVFVGGYVGPPCPPNADCAIPEDTTASDGAALDLEDGTWRRIADAPAPVGAYSSTAVVGDTLYVLTGSDLLAWDASEDAWTEIDPPAPTLGSGLVADTRAGQQRLLLVSGSDERGDRPDRVYDPEDGSWSQLPDDPLRPAFDRVLVSTPSGLVLTAKPIAPDGGPEDPALVEAAVLPPGASTWRRVPSGGDQLGGWSWTWTGRRLVDPTPGGADGGQVNNYGRTIPYGGAFDPATQTWAPLTDAPEAFTGGWAVDALGGRYSATAGWIYDDGDAGRGSNWTRLTMPGDAPAEPGRGVWVGDVLVVTGGADWEEAGGSSPEDVWSTGAWAYRAG